MSKAWICANNYGTDEIVFADTKRRAKAYLRFTDSFEDYRYNDIYPERVKALDYLDHKEGYVMNWHNDEDRIALVKELGWYCEDPTIEECEKCLAKEYCEEWV